MTVIVYPSPSTRNEEYLIDEQEQLILSYLYLSGPASPGTLADTLGYSSTERLVDLVSGKLTETGAGLIELETTGQITFKGNMTEVFRLTYRGEEFVETHQSRVAVPLTLHSYVERMEEIQDELSELLQRTEQRICETDAVEERDPTLEEMMDRIEACFDEIRSNQV
jgi:hypothetical protein